MEAPPRCRFALSPHTRVEIFSDTHRQECKKLGFRCEHDSGTLSWFFLSYTNTQLLEDCKDYIETLVNAMSLQTITLGGKFCVCIIEGQDGGQKLRLATNTQHMVLSVHEWLLLASKLSDYVALMIPSDAIYQYLQDGVWHFSSYTADYEPKEQCLRRRVHCPPFEEIIKRLYVHVMRRGIVTYARAEKKSSSVVRPWRVYVAKYTVAVQTKLLENFDFFEEYFHRTLHILGMPPPHDLDPLLSGLLQPSDMKTHLMAYTPDESPGTAYATLFNKAECCPR